jgi:DNA-directed RNA polymerase subunit alpha
MLSVSLPKNPKIKEMEKNTVLFTIEGCYPGYGTTLGNALRRVLLSSLSGAAITSVKIKGATHEFTTLKGVKEDIVQLILNLKQVRFKLQGVEETVVVLKAKGEKKVKASDIKCTSEVEVVNPEQEIATLTAKSSDFEIEITVKHGIGYVPVEQQNREEKEIGTIAIDAIYNPIKRVNFSVENMRVGKRTDYDRILLEIISDGSITPQEAYQETVEILMAQFNAISDLSGKDDEEEGEEKDEKEDDVKIVEVVDEKKHEKEKAGGTLVETLNFSTRTMNVLEMNKLKTISDIAKYREDELRELEGMGDKGIKEIKKAISKFGIILKGNED